MIWLEVFGEEIQVTLIITLGSTMEFYKLPIDSYYGLSIGLERTEKLASQPSSSTLVWSPYVRRKNCYGILVSITFLGLTPVFKPYKSGQKKSTLCTYFSVVLLELSRPLEERRKSNLDR